MTLACVESLLGGLASRSMLKSAGEYGSRRNFVRDVCDCVQGLHFPAWRDDALSLIESYPIFHAPLESGIDYRQVFNAVYGARNRQNGRAAGLRRDRSYPPEFGLAAI